ncbi:MAG: branched-chain amino acid ABC transporter permease [Alphaproteobacteria bacterium]|nr:branched-chain amino acid ABC transporter permease [Alphaproteobacteria bacterium]
MRLLSASETRIGVIGALGLASVAMLPLLDQGYTLTLTVNIMLYVVLCTAWALFSGPTHYISLATAAFYGLGTYAVALGIDILPFPLLVLIGALVAGVVAGLVGVATLRLSGVYFVIFTLGLAELIRQVVTWLQSEMGSSLGLYVLTDLREQHLLWMLTGMAALVYVAGWLINRSRLGFAMRIIGNDETVARHVGIDTALAKVVLFIISGTIIGAVGAILAPRYSYITPTGAFNSMISFQVVIMALLGGVHRLWGPLLGVIPFTILFDQVSSRFPNHTSLVVGLAFIAIVYLLPRGVLGFFADLASLRRRFRIVLVEDGKAVP